MDCMHTQTNMHACTWGRGTRREGKQESSPDLLCVENLLGYINFHFNQLRAEAQLARRQSRRTSCTSSEPFPCAFKQVRSLKHAVQAFEKCKTSECMWKQQKPLMFVRKRALERPNPSVYLCTERQKERREGSEFVRTVCPQAAHDWLCHTVLVC